MSLSGLDDFSLSTIISEVNHQWNTKNKQCRGNKGKQELFNNFTHMLEVLWFSRKKDWKVDTKDKKLYMCNNYTKGLYGSA